MEEALRHVSYDVQINITSHSEFAICFSGFLVPSETFAAPAGMRTPTLLVQGQHDTLVLPEWTNYLYDRFDKEKGDVRLEMHEGGTFVIDDFDSDNSAN